MSFHLGAETSTIDLARDVSAERDCGVQKTEANRIVWEDRPVAVRLPRRTRRAALPLRKESVREGTLRLMDVEGFDLSACGGTHVARTGGIGIIAVRRTERFKGGTRVEFVCGGRALARFRQQRDILGSAVRQLSMLPAELPDAIERLQSDNKAQRTIARTLQSQLVAHEARALTDGGRIVRGTTAGDPADGGLRRAGPEGTGDGHRGDTWLRGLSAQRRRAAARGHRALSRCGDGLRGGAARIDRRLGGKGGGRPELAQGGGLTAAPDAILGSRPRAARRLIAVFGLRSNWTRSWKLGVGSWELIQFSV